MDARAMDKRKYPSRIELPKVIPKDASVDEKDTSLVSFFTEEKKQNEEEEKREDKEKLLSRKETTSKNKETMKRFAKKVGIVFLF